MKIELTQQEQKLLSDHNISFDPDRDYSDDEALDLLDQVRDAEVYYSQGEDSHSKRMYREYSTLGDKIFFMIPED